MTPSPPSGKMRARWTVKKRDLGLGSPDQVVAGLVDAVKDMMGHVDIGTTMRYVMVPTKESAGPLRPLPILWEILAQKICQGSELTARREDV